MTMQLIDDLTKRLIEEGSRGGDGYFEYAHLVAVRLPKHLHESLRQLVNGPVWDGDVVSRSCRNQLLQCGLAVRVCVKGEQGYAGATYFACAVNKAVEEITTGKKPS